MEQVRTVLVTATARLKLVMKRWKLSIHRFSQSWPHTSIHAPTASRPVSRLTRILHRAQASCNLGVRSAHITHHQTFSVSASDHAFSSVVCTHLLACSTGCVSPWLPGDKFKRHNCSAGLSLVLLRVPEPGCAVIPFGGGLRSPYEGDDEFDHYQLGQ